MHQKQPRSNIEKKIRDLENQIKKLKKSEQATRVELLELEQIFQSMTDGVIVIDTEFNVVRINETFSKLSGTSQQQAVGRKCYEVFPGLLCDTPSCPLKRILSGVERLEYEGEKHHPDGRPIPCIITARALRQPNGELLGIVVSFKDITSLKAAQAELQLSSDRLRKTMGGIIQAMSLTIEKRDPYTAGHQRRVTKLCRAIATAMEFSWERIQGFRMAAAIHDLGKIRVPAEILSKPGHLTENEFGIIKTHPQIGFDILKGIEFSWPIAQIVFQHHERLDGSGYPQGLCGQDILLEARILAVADVVEAMSSHRPYRPALGLEKAIEEIRHQRGLLYDTDVVDACLKVLAENKLLLTQTPPMKK